MLKVFLIILLSLITCTSYQPSHSSYQRNGNNNSSIKNNNNDNYNVATSEKQYLEPFALELKTTDDDGGNDKRFVCTLTDRSVGDVLLEIPVEDVITVEQILRRRRLQQQQKSGEYCEHDVDNNVDGGFDEDDEEEALAFGLLQLRYEEFDPYVVNILPEKHFNVWTLPADMWKETATILPRCYSETFDATRQKVNEFVTRISKQEEGEEDGKRQKSRPRGYTVDDALWAFSIVRTRSLAVPELNNSNDSEKNDNDRVPLALIPGLDLLNHDFGSGTQLQLVSTSSKWVVSSSDSYKAGNEVFLSYGDDKDNWKLLLTYGFTIPNNPNAVVFWSWEDLLDAANKVRPNTFTDYVCQQLLRHPQLNAYTIASEDRATFSFDASSSTPRESLSNGLAMLNSLVVQLGHPEEDDGKSLTKEVLGELIRRRLDELTDCQGRLRTQQEERRKFEKYSEWNPFFEALRVALESEEKLLR
mmetsp:Transcript_22466/g.25046  ORF Transcript_22466/g.25046 Transcript_22466/m.25046 type:complete len:473 (+) Transcript_22466:84-1502(+)